MLPDIETNQDRNSLLFLMSCISPMVRDSIEREGYRTTADSDGSTPEYILEDAFQNLMRDLESIGLSFNVDYSDFVDDMMKLSSFLQLATVLLPNSLYDTIRSDSQIRILIDQILQGSLGDEDSTIQTYLNELGGLDGSAPLRPTLVDFIDQMYPLISQTEVFTDYLRNMMDLYHQERPSVISDEERHTQYRDVIRDVIGTLSDAVNLFETDPDYEKMLSIQNILIHDLIAPDNFIAYAYIFLESKDSLPEDLYDGYHAKWYYYKASNPWCLDYYKIRNSPIDWAYKVLITSFAHATAGYIDNYNEYRTELKQIFGTAVIDDMISSLPQE